MPKKLIVIFLVAIAVSTTIAAGQDSASAGSERAPVPPVIHFSGTVAALSNPVAFPATITIVFALYNEQAGGTALWQESQDVEVDAAGNYVAFLGARTKGGIPAGVFSNNQARWLSVQVPGQGEQPRVLLVSVPYALKAADAETIAGHPVGDFVLTPGATDNNGNSNGAAEGATEKATIKGVAPAVTILAGSANAIAKYDSSGNFVGSNIAFETGDKVGLGVSSPESFLEIRPPTTAGYVKFNNQPWGLRIGSLQDGRQFFGMGVSKTGSDNNYIAATANNNAVNHSIFEMNYDGSFNFKQQKHQADGTHLSPTDVMSIFPTGTTTKLMVNNGPITVIDDSTATASAAQYQAWRFSSVSVNPKMLWGWGVDYGPEAPSPLRSAHHSFFLGGLDSNGGFHDALTIMNPNPPGLQAGTGTPAWAMWIGSPDITQTDYGAQLRVNGWTSTEPLLLLDANVDSQHKWNGNVLSVTVNGAQKFAVTGRGRIITNPSTPSSSQTTCSAGEMWTDSKFIYVCTASNLVKRAALSSF